MLGVGFKWNIGFAPVVYGSECLYWLMSIDLQLDLQECVKK